MSRNKKVRGRKNKMDNNDIIFQRIQEDEQDRLNGENNWKSGEELSNEAIRILNENQSRIRKFLDDEPKKK